MSVPYNVFDPESMEVYENNISNDISNLATNNNGPLVVSWGRSDMGALFRPDDGSLSKIEPTPVLDKRSIILIASNVYHSAAITSTGELYVCGSNDEGQVDPQALDESGNIIPLITKPRLFEGLGQHRICYVSCGLYHTVCVTATGHAISFGGNESGQLGHSPKQISKVLPRTVEFKWRGGKKAIIQRAFCGDLFTLFLTTSGDVYSCGVGECTGHNTNNGIIAVAEKIDALLGLNIISLAAGSSHSLALTSSGEMYSWGLANNGQLGIEDNNIGHIQIPQLVPFPLPEKPIGIAAGYSHSLAWTESGNLYGTGMNKNGQLGLTVPRVFNFSQIDLNSMRCFRAVCGSNHSLALCHRVPDKSFDESPWDTYVYGWGLNNFCQVSAESTVPIYRSPIDISKHIYLPNGLNQAIYIAAGGDQSFLVSLRQESKQGFPSDAIASPSQTESFASLSRNYAGQPLMKRQFSTQASRAVIPLDDQELVRLIQRANNLANGDNNVQSNTELSSILSIAGELFSTPALLAGSFVNRSTASGPLYLDINGVENCYKALLQLGTSALVRLQGAILQALSEMESADSTVPESAVRILMILWQFPINSNPLLSADLFKKILFIWSKLPNRHKNVLMNGFYDYPSHVLASRIIQPIKEHLSMYIESKIISNMSGNTMLLINNTNQHELLIHISCECLNWFYVAVTNPIHLSSEGGNNDVRINKYQSPLLSKDFFYHTGISDLSDEILIRDFFAWKKFSQQSNKSDQQHFYICQYSFLLSIQTKQRMLLNILAYEQQQIQRFSYQQGLLTGQAYFIPYFILHIARSNLLQQTLSRISICDDIELKKPMKVIFDNEEGIDEGGVKKEFFQLLIHQLLSLEYGMFVPTYDHRLLWFNKDCTWCNDEYHLIGILLGLAVYNGVLLDIHFPMVLYKKLLQIPITMEDLIPIDSELYHGLQQLLQYSPKEDIEQIFCRNFEIEWDSFGTKMKHELIPNGSNIPVTDMNYKLYVDKVIDWMLSESIKNQFDSLYNGFKRVIDPSMLILLRPNELELLMIGTPQLDFHKLQSNAQYISGSETTDAKVPWNENHPTIKYLWEVIHELDDADKQKFLLFTTGSNKAPLGGLENLGLKIQRMCPDGMMLPTSHTCFNVLMLPEYSSKEKLKDRLLKAIHECEGFGLK